MYHPWPHIDEVPRFAALDQTSLQRDAAAFPVTGVTNFEVPTFLGDFILGASAFGASLLFFPGTDDFEIISRFDYYGIASSSTGRKMAIDVGLELMGYAVGEVSQFETPVDLSFLTEFQQDILLACRQVPFGEVVTTSELATMAGHPGRGGAAACVLRHNPLPILIPCHRVLSAKRTLGSYCGHPTWKQHLLAREGVEVSLGMA